MYHHQHSTSRYTFTHCSKPTHHRQYPVSRHAFEHSSKLAFWILGIAIVAWLIFTFASAPKNKNTPSVAAEERLRVSPIFTKWLTPYLTSNFRRVIAVTVYTAFFAAQLLEGYWVLVTMLRFTLGSIDKMSSFGLSWVMALEGLTLLIAILAVFGFGGIILLFQAVCIMELCGFDSSPSQDEDIIEKEAVGILERIPGRIVVMDC